MSDTTKPTVTTKRAHFEFKPDGPRRWDGSDGELEAVAGDHCVTISVTDEQAVDSYNQTFTCEALLPRPEAERLRDWLIEMLS
jgi:hypothetical protein